jgi:hypothetical protein
MKLTLKPVYCMEDCQRLQRIALAHNFELTLLQCQEIWQAHSDDWSAGWLILTESDDETWEYMTDFIEEDHS